ncbi:MAG: 2-succinyl-5-enolpyruvyl-6-hydroxy-3-cyclohexene-1-carboxylic-acid synthase, partial [Saezia sp.]
RNAPLIQCFTQDDFFTCHTIVDERNAGFYALGIIQKLKQPVVVCCTSGSAVLNYAPAVSEAFYQQLPMIVLTADRTPEWVGQMDGQTLPQPKVFEPLVKRSVNLPEVKALLDEWYCNRLVNEALIACTAGELGPVHINIALSEPLFDYSQSELPAVRKIEFTPTRFQVDVSPFAAQWQQHQKRLIIVGQLFYDAKAIAALEQLAQKTDCVILGEHLSNCHSPAMTSNFDAALAALSKHEGGGVSLSPDLVISFGGHIVSKRLKHFLREHPPAQHWHLSLSHEVVDLYQALTHLIQADAASFLSDLVHALPASQDKPFQTTWKQVETQIPEPDTTAIFSDMAVTHRFINALPANAALHLANSSVVRNAQMFALKQGTQVYCNRGTNGIESSLPSAVGYASVTDEPVYLAIGDLSFFYTVGALWNTHEIKNLRI